MNFERQQYAADLGFLRRERDPFEALLLTEVTDAVVRVMSKVAKPRDCMILMQRRCEEMMETEVAAHWMLSKPQVARAEMRVIWRVRYHSRAWSAFSDWLTS